MGSAPHVGLTSAEKEPSRAAFSGCLSPPLPEIEKELQDVWPPADVLVPHEFLLACTCSLRTVVEDNRGLPSRAQQRKKKRERPATTWSWPDRGNQLGARRAAAHEHPRGAVHGTAGRFTCARSARLVFLACARSAVARLCSYQSAQAPSAPVWSAGYERLAADEARLLADVDHESN